jgi:FAD-dependent oxidoreductase domain-containing protein 1
MREVYDVVIVGGAVMGSSLACHLAASADFRGRILVIDKDMTYAKAASSLSLSSIRQQFSTSVNIRASLYGIDFLRNAGATLSVDGDAPDIHVVENGYLYLAASDAGGRALQENHALQTAEGADIALLDQDALRQRFPWLNSSDIQCASWGRSGEGWFDGYSLMQAFRRKARSLGVTYLQGEVTQLNKSGAAYASLQFASGETIAFGALVNCAGASGARAIAAMADVHIPVYAKKRCVFTFSAKEQIPDCPLIIDPSGVYARTEGAHYVCGYSPDDLDETDAAGDFDVDWRIFDDTIWPALAHRAPLFEAIRPGRAWAGHYDVNLFDENAIVGRLPSADNLYVAAGFSGHGMQQSPAVGRGVAELILNGRYTSLDLSPLSFERIARGAPLTEKNII